MAFNIAFQHLGRQRKERVFRERFNIDSMTDSELRKRYRFGRASIMYICGVLEERLKGETKRSKALSVLTMVLVALRFYASGSFLQILGDTIGIDKSTASRVIRKVSLALASLVPIFVKWPSENDKNNIKVEFFKMTKFPGVIGCIDGTHVRIQAPSDNEPVYVNRKGYHSINVQAVCDHQGKFINIVAKWPGSSHDSHIFRMSYLKPVLESQTRTFQDGILLGDSGYACKPYLMTPYLRPSTASEEKYNLAHSRTRSTIERAFGWLKRRFHILQGEIRMKPERVCTIIGACVVLHNIALQLREPMNDDLDDDDDDDGKIQGNYVGPEDGRNIRTYITRNFFS